MGKNQHVVPHNEQWAVRGAGNGRVTSQHGTQKEAIAAARGIAINQQSEVVIHRPDGRIRDASFDIAAIMYHANQAVLRTGVYYELAVLAETQRFLDLLYQDKTFARSLLVPDGSRKIFDNEDKFGGLLTLSVEMDDLAREVAREQSQLLRHQPQIQLEDSRKAISSVYVPA